MNDRVLEFLIFLPLAVLTNTAFPYPFEPVLIRFAERHSQLAVWSMASVGSVGAGIGALIDIRLTRSLSRLASKTPTRNFHRGWFYPVAFLGAFLPAPWTLMRVALLKGSPQPLLFAATVMVGRFPRYLLVLGIWRHLEPPRWTSAALLLVGVPLLVWQVRTHVARRAVRQPWTDRGSFTGTAMDPNQ